MFLSISLATSHGVKKMKLYIYGGGDLNLVHLQGKLDIPAELINF